MKDATQRTKTHTHLRGILLFTLVISVAVGMLMLLQRAYADTSDIVLSVPFSEGSGSTTVDRSANALVGTVANGALWNTGKYGTAIQADGINDHVEFANANHLNIAGNTITLSAWVYPTATSSTRIIFGKPSSATQNTAPNFSYGLLTVNGKPRFHLRLGSTTYTLNSSANLTLNTWQHISGTYDGTTMRIYLGGIQRGTRAATGNLTTFQTPLRIGVNGARTQAWAGRIDDVRVYTRALSLSEIQADMALSAGDVIADTTLPTASLTAPLPNAVVGGTSTVSATATDNMSVAGVTFLLDGVTLGQEDVSAPYSLSWNTRMHTNGLHTLEARARDSANNTSSATMTITIFNDTTPPSSPQNLTGETLSSQSISLSWSSSTDDVAVAGYRIYKNGVLSGTTLTTASTQSNLIASTTYEFGVIAYDSAGNMSSTSTVSVTTFPNTVGTSSGMFPLSISGNGKYLVDAQGSPFFMHGDTAWSLMAQLTVPEAQQYLDDRKQKGFNTVMVSLVEHAYADNPPLNTFGVAPFLVPNDMSTVNEEYFTFTDQILAEAAARDMLVLLFPAYVGCCGGDGWQGELGQTSLPGLRNYGRYLGTKFGAYENIIWMMGGDRGPGTALDGIREIVQGIEETAGPQLFSVHNGRYQSGVTQYPVGESWIDINTTYSDCSANNYLREDAERSPTMPFFFIEGLYEDEGGIGAVGLDCLRGQAYRPFLMGGFGHLFGNNPIWNFNGSPITPTPKTWQEALNSEGSQSMVHVGNLMRSRAWHLLVPDFNHTVLTSGYGTLTNSSYAPAARTSDGKTIIVYTPSQQGLTIAMSAIQGAQVNAWWYNVTTGSSTLEGVYPASGSRTFTPPWSGDSVLVLDDAAMGYSAPGITMPQVPVPTATLSASPSTITVGQTTTLTWSSSNSTSCIASDGWSGVQATSGVFTTPGLTASTTYTLTCIGEGGTSAPQSVSVSVVTESAETGLDFPNNASVPNGSTVRFKFTDPHLNGLPIYGPNGNGVTYIWRIYPRYQPGYYTAFFWGNDDGQGTLDTFRWKGGLDPILAVDSYYGAHPYPRGGGDTTTVHDWEVSVEGDDFINGPVVYNRWYTQALRVWSDASGKHHEFYWDLPNVDAAHRVVRVSPTSWGNVNPPQPALTWGDAPWQPGNEMLNGVLRGMQIYNSNLSLTEIMSEINAPLSTQAGNANIWYLNVNPTPTDITDKSGKGNNPAWVGSLRPTLYSSSTTTTPTPVNGSCGTANGTTLSVAPTTNLCTLGTASSVTTNTGTYTWSCGGLNGGTTAQCSATRTTIAPEPTAPTGLTGTGTSVSTINLTWNASQDDVGVAGYSVMRNGLGVGTTTSTTFTDSGLTENTTYTYTVMAFDGDQHYSVPSSPAQATTFPTPDTEAPTIPSAVVGVALTWSQVQISWASSTDNRGVAGYRVYRNGVQVATTSQTSMTDSPVSASSTYNYTVRAYDASGNQSAESSVASVTTPGLPPPSSGLLAAYSFDEGSGTLLLDRTTNGRNGTISGSPAWTTGKNGLTVDFDGTNDAISLGSILPIQGIPALTLSAWVKRNAPNELVEIGKQGGSGGDTLAIELWNDGLAYFGISSPSGYAAGYVPLNDTAWHHVALIYDGTQTGNAGKLKGYIDGVQQTLTFTGTIPSLTTTNTNEFNVGKIGGAYTGGLIDDLRVYSRAQSEAEIQADMTTPVQ